MQSMALLHAWCLECEVSVTLRAVREMLYRGVGDTYTRFLPPTELDTMRKYDITGVGLNLGTAEECRRRTVWGWVGVALCCVVLCCVVEGGPQQVPWRVPKCSVMYLTSLLLWCIVLLYCVVVLSGHVCVPDQSTLPGQPGQPQDLKLPGSTGREGEPGVWVLGLLRGGAADVAGIRQGDKLLEVRWGLTVDCVLMDAVKVAGEGCECRTALLEESTG